MEISLSGACLRPGGYIYLWLFKYFTQTLGNNLLPFCKEGWRGAEVAPKLLVVLQPCFRKQRQVWRWDKALLDAGVDGGTFLPGPLGKKIRRILGNCVWAELCVGIAPHPRDTPESFPWSHSSGLCPLQQVRRLHLELMSSSQLFTAMDVGQVLGELNPSVPAAVGTSMPRPPIRAASQPPPAPCLCFVPCASLWQGLDVNSRSWMCCTALG